MPCGTKVTGSLEPDTEMSTTTISGYTNTTYDEEIETSVEYLSTTGECLPNFNSRVRKGELLPMTNFSQLKVSGETSGYKDYKYFPLNPDNHYTNPNFGMRTAFEVDWHLDRNHLAQHIPDFSNEVSAAAAKIYDTGHDTLTFLSELHKVRDMISRMGESIARLATGRKVDPSFFSVPGKWLEYRYGWRTLIFDLEELNETLGNLHEERKRFKERSGTSFTKLEAEGPTVIETSAVARHERTYIDHIEVGVRGSIVADIEPPQFKFNPITTAWELIPFSFIIDWVINIGTYISSLSFLASTQKYYAAGGYQITMHRKTIDEWVYTEPSTQDGTYIAFGECTATLTERVPTTVSLTPPTKLKFDGYKLLDIVAILIQRFR